MKPVSVINHGQHFVTLRATTDRPAEIREALASRDVQHVYKGDQNQAWDAVLANHCLSRAVGDSGAEITFFIQDERLGTADARVARLLRQRGGTYALTEDYFRGRAGAVWVHQDVSHGFLFTEAVSPEHFAAAGVNLHRLAEQWSQLAKPLLLDNCWLSALESLGVALPGSGGSPDRATGLGPAVHSELLLEVATQSPAAAIYYAFTKTDGLYGVVPVENDNAVLSSIPANHTELREAGRRLLLHFAGRGALRAAATPAHRRGVKARIRRVAQWADDYLREHPEASIADFQTAFGVWLTHEIFPRDRIELDRASHFTHLTLHDYYRLKSPEDTLHFFLELALRHPAEFTAAYNEALNRVGFGLQRLKHDPETGYFTPPFFVEYAPGGAGTPVYRYGLELRGLGRTHVTLTHSSGDIVLEWATPVRSAYDLACVLFSSLKPSEGLSLIGKAAAFAAELQRSPRGLGLPRQGSKYAPMVDHLVAGLRERGVLSQPTGLLIRIGLNTLDRLQAMGDLPLRLPRFLQGPLGEAVTSREFSERWRSVAGEAEELLQFLGRVSFGRQAALFQAALETLHALPDGLQEASRSRRLRDEVERQGDAARLRSFAAELSPEARETALLLLRRRADLLAERRALVERSRQNHSGGRLIPEPAAMERLCRELAALDLQLGLLQAAVVRRLCQRAESLSYVNDRPYTLALYLLFGAEIFPPICRQVEFDVEYVSPCPVASAAGVAPSAVA